MTDLMVDPGPSVRWSYSTSMPGTPEWHVVPHTFETLGEAAEAAKAWLMIGAEHNHFFAVRVERINLLKTD